MSARGSVPKVEAADVTPRRRAGLSRDLIFTLIFAGLLLFAPTLLRALFGQASVSYLSLGIRAVALAVLALSWDLVARTGQLSLAHAAFYGAGAYTTAILLKNFDAPLWLGLPLGGIVAGVLALGLGAVTLRLYGIYFAIATLAFTEVVKAVVQELPTAIAGGTAGVNVAPLFRPTFVPGEMERWEIAFLRNQNYFYLYAGLLVVAILVSVLVQRSRLRSAFTAIRTNEFVASVMGVNPARNKLLGFVISSAIVGVLGALEAHRLGSVIPEGAFAVHTTVLALVTPIFGGLYTTIGPLLAAGFLSGIEETLKRSLAEGYLIVYGAVLVISILFMPRGLVGLFDRVTNRRRREGEERP
ncbi:MAG TPA: branched-chain amino acid ABC transporter permease [Trueperaceae bacterium]|nr:branched-chain amino acid ABC transporter permease [Trueperaceae bacterium]